MSVDGLVEVLDALEWELRAREGRDRGPSVPPWGEDDFNRWALRVHEAQAEAYPVLRRFWDMRGAGNVDHWADIPPVPAEAFKTLPLGPADAEAVFRTSGTSRGTGRRGEHRIARLSLYQAAARGPYRLALFPEPGPRRILSLIPDPRRTPGSSLAHMAGFIAEEPEVEEVVWHFRTESGLMLEPCRGWLREAAEGTVPVLILTTAFALVQLLDGLGGDPVRLPVGSTLMETGGFKGLDVAVEREDLYARVEAELGVPASRIVGEYGMTELLSQSWDARAGMGAPLAERAHRFPPWVRTRALDPETLAPVDAGVPGLLSHFDLANAGSVCHVLTQDLGVLDGDGGFRLLGRAADSEARGCSLMAESFLESVRGRP